MISTKRIGGRLAATMLMVAGIFPIAAHAQDTGHNIVSEVRLGILAHDVAAFGGKEPGADLNGEVLFVSPLPDSFGSTWPHWLQWVAHPRPHLGADLNTAGATSQIYAGLTWTAVLAEQVFRPDDAVEFNYFFGGAWNDGERRSFRPDRKSLGSDVLFRVGFEVAYRLTQAVSIGVIYEHSSNAHLATRNQGLNNVGLRIGYRF